MLSTVSKNGYTEKWISNSDKFCGKVLVFSRGVSTSLHYHKVKSEHFLVKNGSFIIQFWLGSLHDFIGDKLLPGEETGVGRPKMFCLLLTEDGNDCEVAVPTGLTHRIIAVGEGRNELCEFSSFHSDADSIRIDLKREWTDDEIEELIVIAKA